MTNQHPITPPPELVAQWYQEADNQLAPYYVYIATQAARWGADQQLKLDAEQIAQAYQAGADQELEACCVFIGSEHSVAWSHKLRTSRRRKPPSLVERFKHPTPIPVTERLPGPEDLNGILEECWWHDHACWYLDTYQANYTHWLPVNALPLPSND